MCSEEKEGGEGTWVNYPIEYQRTIACALLGRFYLQPYSVRQSERRNHCRFVKKASPIVGEKFTHTTYRASWKKRKDQGGREEQGEKKSGNGLVYPTHPSKR